ncbi:hypothetical protein GLOIN_2v1882258, partial [Rhizophagus irregularis DAOM 181602=DAOM 197198]
VPVGQSSKLKERVSFVVNLLFLSFLFFCRDFGRLVFSFFRRSSSVVANKKYRIAEIGFFGCVLWFIGRGILVSSIQNFLQLLIFLFF